MEKRLDIIKPIACPTQKFKFAINRGYRNKI